MHRTNLYLTSEQERELDARAREARVSRSALVRSIIDKELSRPSVLGGEVVETLQVLADEYHRVLGGLFDDDPDLRIDR